MTKQHEPIPPRVELHLIQVDDDERQQSAVCSQGDFRFTSDSRNAKMAAAYLHLAEVLAGVPE